MKKTLLVLWILLFVGGLFSVTYFGVQYQMMASDRDQNISRLTGELEKAVASKDEKASSELYAFIQEDSRTLEGYMQTKNMGYGIGGLLILVGAGLLWKWKATVEVV